MITKQTKENLELRIFEAKLELYKEGVVLAGLAIKFAVKLLKQMDKEVIK